MPRRIEIRTLPALLLVCAAAVTAAAGACDGGPRTPDARVRPAAESAEVSVRFDVSPGAEPTVHVLAFRASASAAPGVDQPDVLGTVDPLAARAPEQGCQLRDVGRLTTLLGERGASIELEEMTGVGVGLDGGGTLLRPFPRLFPDMASIVGGVVAEAGPQPIAALPERVSLYSADVELPVAELAVPAAPRIMAIDGAAPVPSLRVDAREALVVTVSGGSGGGVVELRPFGATVAAACAIPNLAGPEVMVVVPRALVARVMAASSRGCAGCSVAASIEVARRTRLRQLGVPATRVSVEVRATTTVELRP